VTRAKPAPSRAPRGDLNLPDTGRRLAVDAAGRVAAARWIASPNRDARPADAAQTLVVIHGISLPPRAFGGDGVVRLFTNTLDAGAHPYYATIAHLRVSAHFFIRRDGALLQFVSCDDRAWHAGASSWRGRERCNDYSIGIELEGADDVPYTARQYAKLAALLRALKERYPVAEAVGHSDVAPGRKTDPGPAFDWDRLARLTGTRRLPARPSG
jgi:N-acetyl-anhydromuramoyl-L-alanine amidase